MSRLLLWIRRASQSKLRRHSIFLVRPLLHFPRVQEQSVLKYKSDIVLFKFIKTDISSFMNPSSMLSKVLLARVKAGFTMLVWGRSFRLFRDPGWMCSKKLFEISIVFLALKKNIFLIALMFKLFYSKTFSGDSIHFVGENLS